MMTKTNKLIRNIGLSVFVQIISLATSFVLNLVVPKFVDIIEYSHWQSYILYASYVSILQFGLIDGMILKYSQYDYEDLDKEEIRSQLQIFLMFLSFVSVVTIFCSIFFLDGYLRILTILVSISILTKNHFWYSGTILQITYRINKYAIVTVTQKVSCLIIIVLLLCCGVNNFIWLCIGDIIGDIMGGIVAVVFSKELIWGRIKNIRATFVNIICNVKSGSFLLIANLSASFLVGGAKMVIQNKWGDITFGKVSLSFSLTHLFLTFITAISIVLFPALKRTEKSKLGTMYISLRDSVSSLLFLSMSAYVPCCYILELWLPQYSESLVYLGLLLPIIAFTARNGLLTNNYLKVLRQERKLFFINIISIIVGIVLYIVFAYGFNNLYAVLVSVVIIESIKFFVSEVIVWKFINVNRYKAFLFEVFLLIIFYVLLLVENSITQVSVYLLFALIYAFWNLKNIKHKKLV